MATRSNLLFLRHPDVQSNVWATRLTYVTERNATYISAPRNRVMTENPSARSMDNESLALALWHEQMCVATESIQYPNGKIEELLDVENKFDVVGIRISRRISVFRTTDILGMLAQDRGSTETLILGGFTPFTRLVASSKGTEYQITAGDVTVHGSYGYISVSDMDGNLKWLLFLKDQNPFQAVFLIDGIVHGFSTSCSWCALKLDTPKVVHCEDRDDWRLIEFDRASLEQAIVQAASKLDL